MATTAATRPGADGRLNPVGSNGAAPARGPVVAPPSRRVRVPELAVGLLVTIGFALGAVLWHLNATTKVPALAVSGSVKRGEVVGAEDVRVVYVATDDPVAHLSSSESARVVGRIALVDLAQGTLLTPNVVATGAVLDRGDGVVGLALEPGQYPALGLAPGDRVNVIRPSEGTASGAAGTTDVIARGATVFAVKDLPSDRKLVSVLMSESDANVVAAAAGTKGLRLVLVAP